MPYLRAHSLALIVFCAAASVEAKETNTAVQLLSRHLAPYLACLQSDQTYTLSAHIVARVDGSEQQIDVAIDQVDGESFRFKVDHEKYSLELLRSAGATAMLLPVHKVAFLGTGSIAGDDVLAPSRNQGLISSDSMVSMYSSLIKHAAPLTLANMLTGLLKIEYDEQDNLWRLPQNRLQMEFDDNHRLRLRTDDVKAEVSVIGCQLNNIAIGAIDLESRGYKVVPLERAELERHLARGFRRGIELLAPAPTLTHPRQESKRVPHGELRWIEGQRVVLLQGSPEEVGTAHAQLLREETQRCVDSVLYMFGTFQTINTGRWFPHDLQQAYARLKSHIPADHQRETLALADGLQMDRATAEVMNVFPELFHCSGFAAFGDATIDGKLYHGRVLDYMTTIGLQDSAVTFVTAVDGKIPFINIGYAGFVGSVSGMNERQISLGEMGGRGEGQWDGVPMATLMRRALEECSTLEEVKALWQNNPRTCEYYYVFADGKTNEAVGVAATPTSLEFVLPGQSHEQLGAGIKDTVVLSAGDRLTTLRTRVQQRYGEIDTAGAQWLMSRPVAMKSNLHNVLFVPADGICYVANADHKRPAAEMPYVRFDMKALLESMQSASETTAQTLHPSAR